MQTHSDWYTRTEKELSPYQDRLSKKEYKKYKIALLLRVASRVDSFSAACGECQMLQPEITRLAEELGNLIQMPGKEGRKNHNNTINSIIKHLQKEHKLVSEGHYLGIGMAIGAGIGTALGAALGNTGAGSGLGTALGVAIGAYLNKKAKDEDRVI